MKRLSENLFEVRKMSFTKILDMNDRFLKIASDKHLMADLSHEIEIKLRDLDDSEGLPYGTADIVQLIDSIEKDKMKCLHGHMSAKQLYREIDHKLTLFKIKHPGFDYMNDSAIDTYYA
jgi:hypothetical protein